MCEVKFTKGEWEVKRTVISDFRVKVKDKKGEQGKIIGDIRMEANAHLIATAPEMYDELQEVSNWLNSQLGMGEWHKKIEKLLAKARGEHV